MTSLFRCCLCGSVFLIAFSFWGETGRWGGGWRLEVTDRRAEKVGTERRANKDKNRKGVRVS